MPTPVAVEAAGSHRRRLLGSAVPSRDIPRYVELWRAGSRPLERLVSARIGLDELPRALDRLAAGEELRQLITFDERTPA